MNHTFPFSRLGYLLEFVVLHSWWRTWTVKWINIFHVVLYGVQGLISTVGW